MIFVRAEPSVLLAELVWHKVCLGTSLNTAPSMRSSLLLVIGTMETMTTEVISLRRETSPIS
jgi:hypothetical protein